MRHLLSSFVHTLRKESGYVLCFVALVILLCGYAITPNGQESTDRAYDIIRTTETRNEAIIIGIDDKSLQEFGAWPWNRTIFADLAHVLDESGVRVAVYDVLFLELRTGDDGFLEILATTSPKTILAAKLEGSAYLSSYLASGTTTSALANVNPDADGKVRRYSAPHMENSTCVFPLALQAFNFFTFKEGATCSSVGDYFRYPEKISTYSLVDVVRGEVPKEALQGKVAFIGSTSLDLSDHFIGMEGAKVPGVFVHASMFTSLLNSVHDKKMGNVLVVILLLLLSLASATIIWTVRSVYTQVGFILGIVTAVVIFGVILFGIGVILPLPWMLASILVSAAYVALVRFVREKKQNEEIESLFSKYVHKDVLKELMQSGSGLKLGGEKKSLTVLFSDIRGFTTLSESLSPEELTYTLNGYLSAMTPHILEEKGTIDKFIGDAIMAFWNAPLTVPNHQLHAVRSALRMHRALRDFNREYKTSLACGIAIHTGFAVVGNVGGKDRVNYTILGDTVNLTSRLEGLTKKYGVATIVTKAVMDAIEDKEIAFRCLDVITVAGKSTPTTLYEARDADDFSPDLVKKYETALTYYYEGKWDKAETAFKKLAKEGDLPSEKMLARIPELRKRKEWDGIWRFDEK